MSRYLYKKIQNISPESLNFQHSGLKLTTLRYDREGVEEFCRQWGLDIPKEQGKPTGKKKRERER